MLDNGLSGNDLMRKFSFMNISALCLHFDLHHHHRHHHFLDKYIVKPFRENVGALFLFLVILLCYCMPKSIFQSPSIQVGFGFSGFVNNLFTHTHTQTHFHNLYINTHATHFEIPTMDYYEHVCVNVFVCVWIPFSMSNRI